MKKQFILTLGTDNTIDIVFDILDTNIANKWATEVARNYPLYEADRFKSWPSDGKSSDYYKQQLVDQITIINNYCPRTIKECNINSQSDLNYLHKFFEDLRGEISTGTDFFNQSPVAVKLAIEDFNVYIHEYEHLLRNSNYPEIVCTYSDRLRYRLEDDDYQHFTFKWEFGSVYINYCEVGKPLLDVFKDADTYISFKNVRPLEYYSADFTIKFGPSTPDDIYQHRLQAFNCWYKNYSRQFKHLSLGMIPVATINLKDSNLDKDTVVTTISNYLKVNTTCIV
jgi:hypothetical protein